MAPKTVPPHVGGLGSVPPGGNPKVTPSSVIQFDDDVDHATARKNRQVKKQQARAHTHKKGGFFCWLIRSMLKIGFFYLLIGAFWNCSSKPLRFDYKLNDLRSHCRALAHAKLNLQPIAQPYIDVAYARVQPYTKPYIDVTRPYAKTAWKTVRPYYRYANKQGQRAYKRHVEPTRKLAVKRGRAYVDPHLKTAQTHYNEQLKPHVDSAYRAIKPWQEVYRRDVAPYFSEAYVQSLAFGSASYHTYIRRIHPLVVRSLQQLRIFYVNHLDPAMRRIYASYLLPQVDKVMAKVFGHRAHALSSKALRNATAETCRTRQEAKGAKEEKVTEAKVSLSRVQEDPTLLDRLIQAKDHLVGGPFAAADPVASAASDAELEVETASTKEQLQAWEAGLTRLIKEEYTLTVERLAEVRSRFAENLPDRFSIITEDVEIEVEGIFARLAKSFDKLYNSDRWITEVVDDGKQLVEKQKAKLQRSRAKATDIIDGFYSELQREEYQTQKASVAEVDRYIVEAHKSYQKILKYAKFPKTRDDWKDWDDGMGIRSKLLDKELSALRQGSKKTAPGIAAIDAGQEGDIQRQIAQLQKQIQGLYDTALAELGTYATVQLAKLGSLRIGKVTEPSNSVLDSVANGAKQLGADVQSVIQSAADAVRGGSASNPASSASAQTSSRAASASSLLNEGAKSAGLDGKTASPQEAVGDLVDAAKIGFVGLAESLDEKGQSIFGQASKVAGLKPTSETPGGYVEAAAEFVVDGAAYARDVKAVVHSATRSAASIAGYKPSPKAAGEYVEAVGDCVESAVSAGSKAVLTAADGAGSAAHTVTRSLASVVGIKPSLERAGVDLAAAEDSVRSVAGDGVDSAGSASFTSSAAHSAGCCLSSLEGLKPTLETSAQYVEAADDNVQSAASAISFVVVDSVAHDKDGSLVPAASSAVSLASSIASSVYSDQASSVTLVASQASKGAIKAAGRTAEPEGAIEYLESVVGEVKSAVTSVADSVKPSVSSSVQSEKMRDEL